MNLQTWQFRFTALGGSCEIRICTERKEDAMAQTEAAISEIDRIEKKFSRYREDSFISRINQGAGQGEWFECDAETCWLLDYADTLYTHSDGLFDITSGVLRRAWNFREARLPNADAIAALLPLIGWRQVEREGARVRLPQSGMEIDLGGFGKEYATDNAANLLSRAGIRHGYVNLGGDIHVMGPQPDGQPWLIGIQNPRQKGEIIATIPLTQGGLATSGDYEKFFEIDDQRYCHVLHPRTGYPVSHWRSISVMAPLTIAAGSYSTIAMLKERQAPAFLEQTGLDFLAIDHTGNMLRPG